MYDTIEYEDIDKNVINGKYCLIDVRSPKEYNLYTIPNSINIPILNDEERKIVGTTYIQESVEKAKKIGIEIVSRKLPYMYDEIVKLNKEYKYLIFFCARGGYRSKTLVSLLKSLDMNVFKLNGGYKKYRKYILKALPEIVKDVKFVVLYGNTGVGKTEILKCLKEKGMDILDLEGCANHRGSFFGSVGLGKQNSQKMFESLIYESLKNRKSNIVFVEGESKRIGKVHIPDFIFNAMKKGVHIKIDAPLETRVENIYKDYVKDTDLEIINALEMLRNTLGHKNINRYKELIYNHKYKEVIRELMVKYYDPLYGYKRDKYDGFFENINSTKTADEIINWINNVK